MIALQLQDPWMNELPVEPILTSRVPGCFFFFFFKKKKCWGGDHFSAHSRSSIFFWPIHSRNAKVGIQTRPQSRSTVAEFHRGSTLCVVKEHLFFGGSSFTKQTHTHIHANGSHACLCPVVFAPCRFLSATDSELWGGGHPSLKRH